MKMPTDEELDQQRLAGEITLILRTGTEEEKRTLLTAIEQGAGIEERQRLERWVADGMPGA